MVKEHFEQLAERLFRMAGMPIESAGADALLDLLDLADDERAWVRTAIPDVWAAQKERTEYRVLLLGLRRYIEEYLAVIARNDAAEDEQRVYLAGVVAALVERWLRTVESYGPKRPPLYH
jgi:hypothetical protein